MELFEQRTEKKQSFWAKGLRAHRESVGISLRQVAKSCGISPAFLSKVEHRKMKVNEETAKKIEACLLALKN